MSITTLQKLSLFAAATAVLILLTGCSSVSTKNPVGQPLAADEMQQLSDTLDGVWSLDDSIVLHVKHVGNGELRTSQTKWEEDHFTTQQSVGLLRKLGDRFFVNVRDAAKTDDPYMVFYLIPNSDTAIIGYAPDIDAFKAAVESGDLAGEVKTDENDNTSVLLTADTDTLNAYLTDDRIRILFDTESPMLFRKVADLE